MFLVELALALIAFGGGLFLVAKAKAENLSVLFRIGAWLIIVVSLLIMLCVGTRSIMRLTHHNGWRPGHDMMMDGMYGRDGMMHDGMHNGWKDGNRCPYMKGGHKTMCCDSTMCDSTRSK